MDPVINSDTMDFILSSPSYGPILLSPREPAGFSQLVMPGGEAYVAEGGFGKMLVHEMKAGPLNLYVNVCHIKDGLSVDFKGHEPVLQVVAALRNELGYKINGLGPLSLKEGQFNLVYMPRHEGSSYMEDGKEYKAVNLHLPLSLLQQFTPLFPLLHNFIGHIAAGRPAVLFRHPGWLDPHMHEILHSMIKCREKDNTIRSSFFDGKVKELLFAMLMQEYSNSSIEHTLVRQNIEAAYEAASIIESDREGNTSPQKLAHTLGISEHRLTTTFSILFGLTLSEAIAQLRMKRAWTLVLTTNMPLKQIAKQAGYASLRSFYAAFKHYFKCMPSLLRK